MANKAEQIIEVLEPLAAQHGLDLVTVEVAGTRKNPILRVLLDTLAGGITLDELADAQEWVDAAIEQVDPFQDAYMLEVSSPGIDRPLRKPQDFERFAGEDCIIYLKAGEGRSKLSGVLCGIEDGLVRVECEGGAVEVVDLARIKRAHIIGRIDFNRGVADAAGLADTTE